MKNLNEMGVQEMNYRELKKVEGGGPLGIFAACSAAYMLGRGIANLIKGEPFFS